MKRRNFVASAAAVAALPRIAIGQSASKTLIFVPQANLTSLDPVWTTATVTRNYAYMVFDTLYGTDANLEPQPQMAAGHTIEDDGKRWTIKLRDGLFFHDGEPVRASDCVASLRRWMVRDKLRPDGRRVHRRARGRRRPHAGVPPQAAVPAIAQGARQDAAEPGDDHAGPHRRHRCLQADHRDRRQRPVPLPRRRDTSPGILSVFAKFDKLSSPAPRPPASPPAPRTCYVDRVEWRDHPRQLATAVNALKAKARSTGWRFPSPT